MIFYKSINMGNGKEPFNGRSITDSVGRAEPFSSKIAISNKQLPGFKFFFSINK
jgi:hypothetical protein